MITLTFNSEAQSFFDSLESPNNKENTTDFYKLKSDSDLFNMGFYKIRCKDSIYYFIKNRKIESLVDYSNCNHSSISFMNHKLKETLDCVDKLFLNSNDSILHNYFVNNKSFFTITKTENGKIQSSGIDNYAYHLFPKLWFSIQTEDSLKVKSQFSIKVISLGERGDYMNIVCENDLLPQSTPIYENIKTVLTPFDSLSVLIWYPETNYAFKVPAKHINNILEKSITKNALKFKENFKTFPDTALIACISYNRNISSEGKLSKKRPILEFFFTINDYNNILIVSNGYQYAGYEFKNINKLRKLFNKLFPTKQ